LDIYNVVVADRYNRPNVVSSSKKGVDLITVMQVYVGAATVAGDRALSSGASEGSAQKTTLVLVRTLQQDADAQSRCDEM